MDYWRTQPAHVEVKKAAKKRSAAKSKPVPSGDQPVAPPPMDMDLELPTDSGNEAAAGSDHREELPQVGGVLDDDDVPMSMPSPAPTNEESIPAVPESLPRKRPAASSSKKVLKRPAVALKRPSASMPSIAAAAAPVPEASSAGPVPVAPMPSSPAAVPVPAAPAVAGPVAPNPADDGSTTLRIRGQLSIVLPAGVTVGCPKCRDSRVGCGTCRRAQGFTLENSSWKIV